jgi:hypothetical protein
MQYVPGPSDGIKLADVAVAVLAEPAVSVTVPPTWLPPEEQGFVPLAHTRNFTVPVGLLPVGLPVTVTPSVSEPPTTIDPDGVDFAVGVALPTVKHSSAGTRSGGLGRGFGVGRRSYGVWLLMRGLLG